MDLLITPKIARKLREKHNVSEPEVFQCFLNRTGKYAHDYRDAHQTEPPTLWFISQTDAGRQLKIVLVRYPDKQIVIKSAYEPDFTELRLYRAHNKRG
jgi:hypothetical protein